jgi:integrase
VVEAEIVDRDTRPENIDELLEQDDASRTGLVLAKDQRTVDELGELFAEAARLAQRVLADSTRRNYASQWQRFETWARGLGLETLPVNEPTFIAYITHLARSGYKAGSVGVAARAIHQMHKAKNLPSPYGLPHARAVRLGIRRKLGLAQKRAEPLLGKHLKQIAAQLHPNEQLIDARDMALLSLGLASSMRRSELCGLNLEDLEWVTPGARRGAGGLVVTIRRSKTDQEAKGRRVGIPAAKDPEICPLAHLRVWLGKLEAQNISSGAVFRTLNRHGHILGRLGVADVWRLVRKHVAAIGLDPKLYGAHSLRAGFITMAANAGKSTWKIRQQTGHVSDAQLLVYYRDAELFEDNAAEGLF